MLKKALKALVVMASFRLACDLLLESFDDGEISEDEVSKNFVE